MDSEWQSLIETYTSGPKGRALKSFVKQEREKYTVYPSAQLTFAAFKMTPFRDVKAVIYGQDPYHGAGQANGLAFSVSPGQKIPPSLDNIYKEYSSDLGYEAPKSGDLSPWASQGVLLLNSILTVREAAPLSHAEQGWEELTSAAIEKLVKERDNVVFILWGKTAGQVAGKIDTARHHIIASAHPSPLSAYRGFFGSKPFSKTNDLLTRNGIQPINWQLNNYL